MTASIHFLQQLICVSILFSKAIQHSFGKIITEAEICAFDRIAKDYFRKTGQHYLPEYWVPMQWAVRLVQKAYLHGNIPDLQMLRIMFKVSAAVQLVPDSGMCGSSTSSISGNR